MSNTFTKKIIFVRHGEGDHNLGTSYDPENINLTKLGIKQAKLTGKYLKKIYGSFDCIYSSPINRCVQTSEIILNELKINKNKIIYDDSLIEIGSLSEACAGMSDEEVHKIFDKNGITKKEKIYEKIIDPFERFEFGAKLYPEYDKIFEWKPDQETATKNIKKFLKKIKKSKHKTILVISHGGIMQLLQKLICNINVYSGNDVLFVNKFPVQSRTELNGNCCCMYIGLMDDNKFKLISPMNRSHLKSL